MPRSGKGGVVHRVLKREFALDDESLEDLKEQFIAAEEVAVDKDGKMLVWTGDRAIPSTPPNTLAPLQTPPPASYTLSHLTERILAEQVAMESRGAADGERKTITALFADLKGSTALIEGLDPEDARAIIDPALQLMMDAVHRYDGYVAQALGDGIFALFGAPLAHEDHPQRALYAALRMQEEMRRYGDRLREAGAAPLHMRVGVNTGEVVVRSIRKDDLHADYVPVGHSTNIAARMEQLANPGSILVTEQTHKLTEGYFEFRALGKTQVKGIEEPVPIFEVTSAGPLRTRLQIAARRGLTRFVGRHSEMDDMQRALAQVRAGQGQIVGVMGEPGLGKSRLFYEFVVGAYNHTPLRIHGCLVLEAFSVSHGKASPYLPIIELLKNYFDITPEDDERKRREKIAGKILILDRSLEDTLPYVFSLFGIEDPQASLHQMDTQIRRQRTFEAVKKLFLRESLNQPLILIFEDLHWIDTETQGFLDMLSDSVTSAKLLLLVNYRPEYRHEWGTKTYYTQLRLAPLGKAEAEELLTFLLGSDTSLAQLKPLILARTEGTPFFMEEVVQTLVEEGVLTGERGQYRLDTTPTELHISPTVQGVLAARIDRLAPDEKALLQQLSVIGRQFQVSLVKHVVTQSEADLSRVLSSLQAKEFLYEQPAFPEVEYLFKHALTQEVTYGTLLQERRKALHAQTAYAMETLYTDSLEDHYSGLAYHYSRSRHTEKAVEYLHLAGQQAAQRSANEEAIQHLTTARELLQTLPETPERARRELNVQASLGTAYARTRGYGSQEAGTAYGRALEMCQRLAETAQISPVMFGLWMFHLGRAAHREARNTGEEMLRIAQQRQDTAACIGAHEAFGISLVCRGEFTAARTQLEHGAALYVPQEHRVLATLQGQDSRVDCLTWAAHALWALGYPDQALQRSIQAVALANELSHPFTSALAMGHAGWLYKHRREWRKAQERAEAAIALCVAQGFPFWETLGRVLSAWVLIVQGKRVEGIEAARQCLEKVCIHGADLWQTFMAAVVAEGYWENRQTQEGLALVSYQ